MNISTLLSLYFLFGSLHVTVVFSLWSLSLSLLLSVVGLADVNARGAGGKVSYFCIILLTCVLCVCGASLGAKISSLQTPLHRAVAGITVLVSEVCFSTSCS